MVETPCHQSAQTVFLFRFMQFMKFNRGAMGLQKWMTRFQIIGNRLIESWMDLTPDREITNPDVQAYIAARQNEYKQIRPAQLAAANQAQAAGAVAPDIADPWSQDMANTACQTYLADQRMDHVLGEVVDIVLHRHPFGSQLLLWIQWNTAAEGMECPLSRCLMSSDETKPSETNGLCWLKAELAAPPLPPHSQHWWKGV